MEGELAGEREKEEKKAETREGKDSKRGVGGGVIKGRKEGIKRTAMNERKQKGRRVRRMEEKKERTRERKGERTA